LSQEARQETALDFAALAPEGDLLRKIPIGYARRHLLLPCREADGTLVILFGRPDSTYALDEIRFLIGPARLVAAPEEVILKKIDTAYERHHTLRAR
jgi:hypothetical protein